MNDREWGFLLEEIRDIKQDVKEVKTNQSSIIEIIHTNNLNYTVSISNLKVKVGIMATGIAFVAGLLGSWFNTKI